MANGVFDQRLQQQNRYPRAEQSFADLPLHLQALAETRFLYRQIAFVEGNFFGQRDIVAVAGQRCAQKLGQLAEHTSRVCDALIFHQ